MKYESLAAEIYVALGKSGAARYANLVTEIARIKRSPENLKSTNRLRWLRQELFVLKRQAKVA